MTASENYGVCDACGVNLTARYWTFDRLVERFDYNRPGDSTDSCATVKVLRSDMLTQCCCAKCAGLAAMLGLAERGVQHRDCGEGPIEVCGKCGGPVDLTKPHVFYQLMDQTESRKPWLTTIQPYDTEALAYVCPGCDDDLAVDEMNVPESEAEGFPIETKAASTTQALPVATDK